MVLFPCLTFMLPMIKYNNENISTVDKTFPMIMKILHVHEYPLFNLVNKFHVAILVNLECQMMIT